MRKKRLIIIGLDGATFDIIDPLIEKGLLPNFKRILSAGSYGILKSTIPPTTPVAWSSFQTGKNPGKHGVFDFGHLTEDYSVVPNNSLTITGKTFYELLKKRGKCCLLINLPYSFPPRINGDVITSWLTPKNKLADFVYPKKMFEVFPSLKNYKIHPTDIRGKKSFIDKCFETFEQRVLLFKEILNKNYDNYDFIFILFSLTDWIQHRIFGEMILDFDSPEGKIGKMAYKKIDNLLGYVIRNLSSRDTLFVMSDHGFKKYNTVFFTNQWLKKTGYLEISNKGILPTIKTTKTRINKRHKIFKKFLYYFRKLLGNQGIYMQRTKVFLAGCNSIYINDTRFKWGIVSSKQKPSVVKEIISKLNKVNEFEAYSKEEIFKGDNLDIAPDIIINNAVTSPELTGNKVKYKDWHDQNGIFIAFGAEICGHRQINGRIYDLAPTILHFLDCPVPSDMDGRVLKEILKDDSDSAQRKVEYSLPSFEHKNPEVKRTENLGAIKKRLEDLGYL